MTSVLVESFPALHQDQLRLLVGGRRRLNAADSVDVDAYVARKAMDGLFQVVAAEELRIRTDPAARTTDLLKSVFGAVAGGAAK